MLQQINADAFTKKQKLELLDRRILTLSGVKNVVSFNEMSVRLELADTELVIDGEALNITRLSLDEGEVAVEGFVYSINYTDGAQNGGGSLFSRLFGAGR